MDGGLGGDILLLFRGVERVAIVAAGVLLIYFGYRLFLALPAEHGSDGRLQMPSASLAVSKVGPGVFFAVFGTFLLWQMAEKAVRVDIAPPAGAARDGARAPHAMAIFGAAAAGDAQALRHARHDIAALNCAEARLAPGLPPELREDVARAFRHARAALLETVWQPAWGGPEVAAAGRLGAWPPGPLAEIAGARHRDCAP